MSEFVDCRTCKTDCVRADGNYGYTFCDKYTHPPMTKADRIRSMSDEKLAKHLVDVGWDCHFCAEHLRLDNEPLMRRAKCDVKCVEHCLEWLKQPAEGE